MAKQFELWCYQGGHLVEVVEYASLVEAIDAAHRYRFRNSCAVLQPDGEWHCFEEGCHWLKQHEDPRRGSRAVKERVSPH